MNLLPPPSTLPPESPVWAYLRDSGGEGQDRSIPRQLEAIGTYCKTHNLKLVRVFRDEAKSGTTTAGRDDFQRMIKASNTGENLPAGLLIWNYARFARDLDDSTYYKSLLRRNNIIIHSLTDPIPEGPYARFVETLIDISNEERSRQISIDARDGLRSIVQQGAVPGTPPLGFKRSPIVTINPRTGEKRTNHRWVIDRKLVQRIRKAFRLRAAGVTLREIHKSTRLYGAINSYRDFFRNRIYIGILEFGDLVIENYCEPLIPMDIWNAVQKKIEQTSQIRFKERHPKRASSAYLLSGILKCAKCGSPMNGNTVVRESTRRQDQGYRCSRAKRRLDCDASRIPRRRIEELVIATLSEYVFLPESIAAHQEIAVKMQTDGERERGERKSVLIQERMEVSRQIANITKAIADMGHSDALLAALKRLETQRAQVRTELDELEIPIQRVPHLSPPEIDSVSKELIDFLNKSPPEKVRQLLRGIIREVHAEREGNLLRGNITYWYPPPFDHPSMELPMEGIPLGAPLYRQLFTYPFEVKIRQ